MHFAASRRVTAAPPPRPSLFFWHQSRGLGFKPEACGTKPWFHKPSQAKLLAWLGFAFPGHSCAVRQIAQFSAEAMAQAGSPGLASQAYGFGPGFNVNEPKPGQAKPKPWFPGQAKPAHHYA
ncbi:hypothetical protein C8F04DRAFT_1194097 [Mycena alexandri]|uniref:Uncharacterized protein n=1 Tax=Mycena alexandri TaxID=1745969 RepID=A0AAD6WQ10_9AGAR|nr:hypothetical protein C8F04DRAFT_1194097 [Mycena alexandri]